MIQKKVWKRLDIVGKKDQEIRQKWNIDAQVNKCNLCDLSNVNTTYERCSIIKPDNFWISWHNVHDTCSIDKEQTFFHIESLEN